MRQSLINEEVSQKTCNIVVRVANLSAKELTNALKNHVNKQMQSINNVMQKSKAAKENPIGKQTVKQLVGQGQGVQSIPVDKTGLGDFERIAKKYDVDFAIVKDKTTSIPSYLVFFKAKDTDAITQVLKEYTTKKMKCSQQKKPSILQKLKEFKELVANIPKREHERKKEQER